MRADDTSELLRLEGVSLTYPKRTKAAAAALGLQDDDDDLEPGETGGHGTEGEPLPAPPGPVESSRPPLRGPVRALHGVTLTVSSGDSLGLLGHPGSGRTTLLSVMAGVLRPTEGRVLVRGHATGLIAAGAGFLGDLSVRRNIVRNLRLLGVASRRAGTLTSDVAEFAGLTDQLDEPLRSLTRVQSRRLGQAAALHSEPSVFLADEDFVVGAKTVRDQVTERLTSIPAPGRALVVATNRSHQLRELCSRAVVLSAGVIVFDGEVEGALQTMRRRDRKDQETEASDE